MRINAITAKLNFNGSIEKKINTNKEFEQREEKGKKVSNNAMTNATKALALATMLSASGAALNSCDKDHEHYYYGENTVNPDNNTHTKEYIYVLDTIDNSRIDTIKIKPGYDSPVSPVIKEKWETLGIDTGDGKIITAEKWFDQYAGKLVKDTLNKDRSSKSEMVFDTKAIGWDADEGGYVEGKNETPLRLRKMVTSDGNLLIKLETPRDPNNISDDEKDWKVLSYHMQKIDPDTIWRYKIDDDNYARKTGYMVKGDEPNTVKYVNFEDAQSRYSDIDVKSEDIEDEIIK